MDHDPTPTPPPANDGKPGIFNKLNTTIAGVTGLVIALGGLAATWDKFFPNKQAEAAVTANQVAEAVPVDETATASAATEEAEPEAGDPTSYSGRKVDGGKAVTIKWDGENWILTEGEDDSWTYDETISPDESKVMAVSGGTYLRWPIEGGEVDESEDKVKWKTYATVDAVSGE